jgi:hypothetical protein
MTLSSAPLPYRAPLSCAEQAYPHFIPNELDRGIHFCGLKEPDVFTTEIRAALRSLH